MLNVIRVSVISSTVGLEIHVGTLCVFCYADTSQVIRPQKHQLPHGLPLPVRAQFVDGLDPSVSLTSDSSGRGCLIWRRYPEAEEKEDKYKFQIRKQSGTLTAYLWHQHLI